MGNCFVKRQRKQISDSSISFSRLYMACRDNDYDSLLRLWPMLTYDELNRIESNGNTALHAACYNNNANCIGVLLIWNCNTTILNKYGETAIEKLRDQHLLSLFTKSDDDLFLIELKKELEIYHESNKWIPNNNFIRGYIKIEDINNVKQMIANYRSNSLKMESRHVEMEREFYFQIHQILLKNPYYLQINKYLIEHDIIGLIQFYISNRLFYESLKENNIRFSRLIILHLSQFRNHAVEGKTYHRLMKMPLFDLDSYKWANKQDNRILETRSFIFTTQKERVTKKVDNLPTESHEINVQMTFNFPEECDTTIRLNKIPEKHFSSKEYEDEILILPYTLFKIQTFNINQSKNRCYITLLNIPVSI